jgi:hypothetical protein
MDVAWLQLDTSIGALPAHFGPLPIQSCIREGASKATGSANVNVTQELPRQPTY